MYGHEFSLLPASYVKIIDCCSSSNIKMVRGEIKLFVKMRVQCPSGCRKSVILLNADFLTTEAQSALRRCIEVYNHSTRFFMTVTNLDLVMRPILSRFHTQYVRSTATASSHITGKDKRWLREVVNAHQENPSATAILRYTDKIYQRAIEPAALLAFMEDSVEKTEVEALFHLSRSQVREDRITNLSVPFKIQCSFSYANRKCVRYIKNGRLLG